MEFQNSVFTKSMIDRYKKKMEELGIRIRPNTVIGSAIVIDNLFRDGYSSVFVGNRSMETEGNRN